ncbi:MAG: diphthine--ammonia ligase [Candidatus Woesearchaeota archaeon]
MCGIIGVFNYNNKNKADKIVDKGLIVLKNRGLDGSNKVSGDNFCIGHNLHAIVDIVKQPIKVKKSIIVANCEIYNWKELNKKYNLKAKNDADMLLKFIEHKGAENILKILDELDGVYAFCYKKGNEIILARDLIGEKPIWFSSANGLAFASEKKALIANEIYDAIELNPRKILRYNLLTNKIKILQREFFSIKPEHKQDIIILKRNVRNYLEQSIKKRITDKKIGVLFSGGIDSLLIAFMLKKMKINFTCYTAALKQDGMEEAEDMLYAEKAAKLFGFRLKKIVVDLNKTEKYIKKIIPLIESSNVVKVGVALPFFLCCEQAKKDKVKVIFSGLGSEEIFAGYDRHEKSLNVNQECISGLLKMYERDLYRDDIVSMANSVEMRMPFLDLKLVDYSLKINQIFKISKEHKKIIIRLIAEEIGIDKEFAWRPKKAAQYGSKFDRAIEKLAKKNGFKYKADYLNSLTANKNLNLGVMWSTGKDSCYAAYLMQRHNYNLKCLISIKSENKYSYMFHTPNIDIAKLHSKAMNIPLITKKTKGDKEHELVDLKKLLSSAKQKYNIDGIITGAIFSNYQRERIEKVADEIGLKIFSPLWHKNQEQEMRELIDYNFKIILSSVAAEGLDKSWLGKELTHKDIDKLADLNKKIGLNVAGEGGEFESLVVDCPLFNKKIAITKSKIIEENRYNSFYVVEKAKLVKKTNE